MADDGGQRADVFAYAGDRVGEHRQRGATAAAAAMGGLVERHHGVAGAKERFHPRQEAQAEAGPAMGQQDGRLAGGIAPRISGQPFAAEDQFTHARAAGIGLPRPRAGTGHGRAEQLERAGQRAARGEPAADGQADAQQAQRERFANGRAILTDSDSGHGGGPRERQAGVETEGAP